jgi:hypothetical protein
MQKKSEHMTRGPNGGRGTLSRREVLAGAAIAALAASTPLALAAPARKGKQGFTALTPSQGPPRRYMAAAAALGDGRILVTGGYDRPWKDGVTSGALNSAMIYDPAKNTWTVAAPMSQPLYDHSATVSGGQLLVIGGSSQSMLSSHETYDPTATSPFAPNTRSK